MYRYVILLAALLMLAPSAKPQPSFIVSQVVCDAEYQDNVQYLNVTWRYIVTAKFSGVDSVQRDCCMDFMTGSDGDIVRTDVRRSVKLKQGQTAIQKTIVMSANEWNKIGYLWGYVQ